MGSASALANPCSPDKSRKGPALLSPQSASSLRCQRSRSMMVSSVHFPLLALVGRVRAVPADRYATLNITYSTVNSSAASTCNDIDNCRTLWGVVYSCLATIFACIYVSYHPDLPDRTHAPGRILAIRVCSAIIAFLFPELVVTKAASQWCEARKYGSPFQGGS